MFDVGTLAGDDVGIDLWTPPLRKGWLRHLWATEGSGRAVPGHASGGLGGMSRLDLLCLSHWLGRYVCVLMQMYMSMHKVHPFS